MRNMVQSSAETNYEDYRANPVRDGNCRLDCRRHAGPYVACVLVVVMSDDMKAILLGMAGGFLFFWLVIYPWLVP